MTYIGVPPANDPFLAGDVMDDMDTLNANDAEEDAYPRPLTKAESVWKPATRPGQVTVVPTAVTEVATQDIESANTLRTPSLRWVPRTFSVTSPADDMLATVALRRDGVRLTS